MYTCRNWPATFCREAWVPKAVINSTVLTITPTELARTLTLFRKIFRKISLYLYGSRPQSPGILSMSMGRMDLGGLGRMARDALSFNRLLPLK